VSAPDDARERALARFAAIQGGANDGTPPAPDEAAHLERMDEVWRGLDAVADNPALLAMRAQARARFDRQAAPSQSVPPRHGWRVAGFAALAASLVAVVGLGWAYRQGQALPAHPSGVAPAEQVLVNGRQLPRAVQLADGTSITLDSQTQLHVANGGRSVRLDYGRAFFAVHHDAAHPFSVQVGDMTVKDLVTRFEVRQEPRAMSVTLVEGKVQVTRSGTVTNMIPGTRLTLQGRDLVVEPVDTAHRPLWQAGMISADNLPVRDIVAQFNRYRTDPLVVADTSVGALRISGEFRLDDPQGLAEALRAMGYHMTVARGGQSSKPSGHGSE